MSILPGARGGTVDVQSDPLDVMTTAYLVSQYPAASHTFIRREVIALRSKGIDIQTFSIRRPSLEELQSADDQAEFEKTYYLLPARFKQLLSSHLFAVSTRPVAYVRVLQLALRHRVPGLRAFIWALFHFVEAIQLAVELERRQIERLHNHFANSGATVGLLASSFLHLPWSLTLHGISETDYPAGLLLSAKIKAASFVACVSEFGRAQAMRISPPEYWEKLSIVRCAVDFDRLPSRPQRDASDRPRIICVGRLSPEKGHLGLLAAYADLLTKGIDAELVFVGDGPEKSTIEQTVSRLKLRKVRFAGMLSEDATLTELSNADVLVIASFIEGLPVVLMEAMALGIPVVASRVAGIPELVVEDQTGLLFTPSNWGQLAEQLYALLTDPQLQRRLGDVGKAKVYRSHNVQTAFVPLIEYLTVQPRGDFSDQKVSSTTN